MENEELTINSTLVWKEVELAFCYAKLIRIYTDKRRKLSRWSSWILNVFVCFTSFSFLSEGRLALIFSIASTITIFLRELFPAVKQHEYELSSLDNAADFYAEYQVDMERIYYELMFKHNTPDSIYKTFFELKKRSTKYYSIVNKYYRGVSNKKEQSVKNQLDEYATRFQFNQGE